MKKVLISVAAGIGIALVVYKLAESGKLDCVCEDLGEKAGRMKQKIKDGIDVSRKQISEIAEEVEEKVMEKLKKAKS